jgi:lipopolysaccharide transport system ATP-binding protein
MSDDVLIRVQGVSKKFCRDLKTSLKYGVFDLTSELMGKTRGQNLREKEFWAVDNVSFDVKRGECLGLIGRNGAGKTTLLRMLNGLIKPDKGRIEMRGRTGALIALGAGFNPILTGRENIYVNASILGLSKKETDEKLDEIIDFAEIGDFLDTPVQSYSSGMAVRLGFSIASTLKPDILLLDEVLAVGDSSFRSKCWRRIGELLKNSAVILVSHEAYAISRMCDRAVLLEKGSVIYDASADDTLAFYESIGNSGKIKEYVSLDTRIAYCQLINNSENISTGGYFDFELELKTVQDIQIDHWVMNIVDQNEEVHAQSLIDTLPTTLKTGVNKINVSIGPLFLSSGGFSLVILLSTNGGKTPVVHSRGELSFSYHGNPNFGPKYYPPASTFIQSPRKVL